MNDDKTPSCWDCIHKPVCVYDATGPERPRFPFISDEHIAVYLGRIVSAQAAACSVFTRREEKSIERH